MKKIIKSLLSLSVGVMFTMMLIVTAFAAEADYELTLENEDVTTGIAYIYKNRGDSIDLQNLVTSKSEGKLVISFKDKPVENNIFVVPDDDELTYLFRYELFDSNIDKSPLVTKELMIIVDDPIMLTLKKDLDRHEVGTKTKLNDDYFRNEIIEQATISGDDAITNVSIEIPKIDTSKTGTYTVTFTLTNSNGTEVTRKLTVRIYDPNSTGNSSSNTNTNTTSVYTPVTTNNDPYVYEGTGSGKSSNSNSALNSQYVYEGTNTTSTSNTTSAPSAVITATDVKINVGDDFDIMNHIRAIDVDGANITDNITVSGNVNTAKPGTYTITYSVVDKNGNTVTKRIKVIVDGASTSGSGSTVKGPAKCTPTVSNSPCGI